MKVFEGTHALTKENIPLCSKIQQNYIPQDSIPVGCLPTAAVASTPRGRVLPPGYPTPPSPDTIIVYSLCTYPNTIPRTLSPDTLPPEYPITGRNMGPEIYTLLPERACYQEYPTRCGQNDGHL